MIVFLLDLYFLKILDSIHLIPFQDSPFAT